MLKFRKIMAIICALSLMATTLITIVSADAGVSADKSVWDGTVAATFADGNGSQETPYLIENASQLAKAVTSGSVSNGKYYKLTKDIVINSDLENNPKNWYGATDSELYNLGFRGTFDGDGHTISGLYYNGSNYAGLFPLAYETARFKNLCIKNSSITTTGNAGVIVGHLYAEKSITKDKEGYSDNYPSFVQCCIAEDVSVNAVNAGGIVGVANGEGTVYISFYNCFIGANLTGKTNVGADIAHGWKNGGWKDFKSYLVNVITTAPFNKNFINDSFYKGTNVYTTAEHETLPSGVTKLTAEQAKGFGAKDNMTGFDFVNVWQLRKDSYPTLRVFGVAPIDVWDGTVAAEFAGGDGSENTPYLIENACQLAKAVKSGSVSNGKYYKLTKDIVINSDLENNPINWYGAADDALGTLGFRGTFDGDGHTISGLYYNGSNYAGLFPLAYETARFKNLCIKNSSITTTGNAGVIVGHLFAQNGIGWKTNGYSEYYPSFVQCCICEDVSVNAVNAGGVVGVANGNGAVYISFYNCFIGANLTGKTNVGADIALGWKNGGNDFYSFPQNVITTTAFSKTLISNSLYKGTNVYTTAEHETTPAWLTKLTEAEAKGSAAKAKMTGFDFSNVWQMRKDSYPTLRVFGVAPIDIWDGTVAAEFAGGDGSQGTPYLIENACQLAKAVKSGSGSSGKYYKLTKDIVINSDLENYPINWYGAADDALGTLAFCGTFDGNGHTISGLYYNGSNYAGLFPLAYETARFKNLCIKNSSITTTGNAGVIVGHLYAQKSITKDKEGYSDNYPSFVQCCIGEDVSVNATLAGGIVGVANGAGTVYISFYNCFIGANLTGKTNVGADIAHGWRGDGWKDFKSYPVNVITTAPFNKNFITDGDLYKGTNVYTTAAHDSLPTSFTKLTAEQAKGAAAKVNMTGFDFDKVWQLERGAYPTLRVFGENEDKIDFWDGTTDQQFAGEGTATSPYLITTAAELAGLVTLGKEATTNKYYRLTTDVDISYKDWYEGSFISGTYKFDGTFDGAGHIVYGMKKTSGSGWGSCTGLFPVIGDNTHIKRVGIVDAHITATSGEYRAGFIFGGGTLTNGFTDWEGPEMVSVDYCYVDSTSTISGGKSGGIGGYVGSSGNGWIRVSDCYTLAASPSSGAIGDAGVWNGGKEGARYLRFYSTSDFTGHNYAYLAVDSYSSATLTTDETNRGAKQLTSDQMTGEAAKTNMQGFDFDNVWQTVDGAMPTLRAFNSTSFEQPVTQVQISTDGRGAQNGTKFVVENTFPGMSKSDITSNPVTVKVEGDVKTVKETGIIIKRSVADDYALDEITNNPITGYRIKGYVKDGVNTGKLNIIESGITFGATVKGIKDYTAQTYTIFTDETLVMGDIYKSSDVASEKGSADGYTANDKYNLGDANFDGSFDVLDLVRIKKYSLGIGYKAGIIEDIVDVNKDNNFNDSDIAKVRSDLIDGKTFSSIDSTGYKLVWEDNFDSAELSSANWGFIDEMGGYKDAYTAHTADVQSIAKNSSGESYLSLRSYYNGTQYALPESVSTKETMNFTYGYVEMRAKLPYGAGVWPSFWLKSPDKTSAGYTTEVDIVEVFGSEKVACNMHKWGDNHDQLGNATTYTLGDGEWHTYGMKWDADAITMYVDGVEKFTHSLNDNFGSENGMDGFKEPMYLIINNHLFTPGFFEANPLASWVTELPKGFKESVYEIDYVRLYQNDEGSITIKK